METHESDTTPEDDYPVALSRHYLEQAPSSEYIEIRGDEQVRAAASLSSQWQAYYAPGASPEARGHSTHRAFFIGGEPVLVREAFPEMFVLRYKYEVAGIKLTILQTLRASLVSVETPPGTPEAQAKVAQRIAATVFFGGTAPLHFDYPGIGEDVARFESESILVPGQPSPVEILGSIVERRIYFLLRQAPVPSGKFARFAGAEFPASLRDAWDARLKRP